LQQSLNLRLPHDLALFSQNRRQNYVGRQGFGQHDAQDGEFLTIASYAQPCPGDKCFSRFPLMFLQQLADLVEETVDAGALLCRCSGEGLLYVEWTVAVREIFSSGSLVSSKSDVAGSWRQKVLARSIPISMRSSYPLRPMMEKPA